MSVHNDLKGEVRLGVPETSVVLLRREISLNGIELKFQDSVLTGIQQIESFIEDIAILNFGVAAIDYEGVADQQASMADSWAGALCCCGQRIAGHVTARLHHP